MHIIPYIMGEDKLSAAQVPRLQFENIVRFFLVIKKFVYNHNPKFTAFFCCELWYILSIKTSASMLFTQSDGQSECTNHIFE